MAQTGSEGLESALGALAPFKVGEEEVRWDDDGAMYRLVRLRLPDGMLAEIDDGTYGELVGVRLYGSDAVAGVGVAVGGPIG